MSEHTKEPWTTNGARIESANEHGWANDGWIIADAEGPEGEANARRIVACVNACAGIPTSRLEAGASDVLAYSMELHKQRDELLETLQTIATYPHKTDFVAGWANDAIAKVKGQT